MAARVVKYNPSFLTDQELVDGFVVRHADLELILEVVRENVHASNQHLMVVGPRGSGKTTLVRRAAAEIRRTPELDAAWFPLAYGEESYEVASAGQFWLEAIHHLGTATGEAKWGAIYQDLLREPDDERLGRRALAKLMDFADEKGKRLLLIVENLNILFGEQISDDDEWSLRYTLMNEPRLMLLGSTTMRFKGIDDPKHAMYELFRLLELEPLTREECQSVWKRVTGREIPEGQARAVQIVTGGNLRLMTILSAFGKDRAFRQLFEDLALLVDDHTDYFKSNIESLPSAERKVFACLAGIWEEATSAEVATAARISASQASAQLKRLEGRGAVTVADREKGKKKYQLTERLYNIYYLMRRSQDSGRVKAVVNFMVQFYGRDGLHEAVADIAREACGLDGDWRKYSYLAVREILNRPEAQVDRERILSAIPLAFFKLPDLPKDLKELAADLRRRLYPPEVQEVMARYDQAWKNKDWHAVEMILREALSIKPDYVFAWGSLGLVMWRDLDQFDESVKCLRKAVELKSDYAWAWRVLGEVLSSKSGNSEEGVECLRRAIELKPDYHFAWGALGHVLSHQLGRPEEGVEYLRKAVELNPDYVFAWAALGEILCSKMDRPEEGVECLRRALELEPSYSVVWGALGLALSIQLERPEEGVECLRKATELKPDYAWAWGVLGDVLSSQFDRHVEAVECLRKATKLEPDLALAWEVLGEILSMHLDRPKEGVECLRKAVELHPYDPVAWAALGDVLSKKLKLIDEGVKCLRKAVELGPEIDFCWCLLGESLLMLRQSKIEEASLAADLCSVEVDTLTDILEQCSRRPNVLNHFAYHLMELDKFECLNTVEDWCREALSKENEELASFHGTLSRALAMRGNILISLDHAAIVLGNPDVVKLDIQESTDVLTTAAAAGLGQQALDILLASPSLPLLEPLAAGLKLYLGLEVKAPQEVKEVAEDVVKRIEHWKQWHADRGTQFILEKPTE